MRCHAVMPWNGTLKGGMAEAAALCQNFRCNGVAAG
jgi:hypothetical protein